MKHRGSADSGKNSTVQPEGGRSPGEGAVPVEKNGEYAADIIGIGHEGEGVGRVNGFTLFIHGALPGEKVLVKVMKLKKTYGYAKLVHILEASPDRVAAPCLIYDRCGGCQLQHASYEAQLRFKRQQVVDNLERIGGLRVMGGGDTNVSDIKHTVLVHPTIGMSDPWRYRNKAQVPFGEEQGGLIGGFYARGSHRIIDTDTCLIQSEAGDDVFRQVKEIARSLGIPAYNEVMHRGLLRHVVVKTGFRTGEIMIVLVINGEKIPRVDQWIVRIREEIKGVTSICLNINRQKTNVIFGNITKVLWGSDVIYDYIGDIKFAISARSFYQVNPVQTEVLYRKALDYAALTGVETVIDAYCGIGTISLFLAQHAKQVYGVEIVSEAIEDAKVNVQLNGMSNVQFAVGKAEEVIPAWSKQGIKPDVIVVDPPRKGCDIELLNTIIEMKPERVVYVSCNPATLARDLRILEDGGFRTVEVQPVDMFPHTVHVETVSLLILI
ncbi:MAG TPA: 23S rRNA (uracil(1939)-C(5))-methyltransferase RlmD [Bacilli bacterium]